MRVLNVVSSAYRATLEEQDDTVIWLTHALKGAGAEIDVLLRGPAVNYVVEGQEAGPLSFGARTQRHAPDVFGQVASLAEKGVRVFVLKEDLERRGLMRAKRQGGSILTRQAELSQLFADYDRVWHW
jgi:hypothetical protein